MRALDVAVEKRSRWLIFSLGLAIGFGGQAGGLYAAHTFAPEKVKKPDLVTMNLVKTPPKPEPPKPEPPQPVPPKPEPPKPEPPKPEPPKPKKKEPPKPKPKPKKKKKRKKRKKPKPKPKPKPQKPEPPKPAKKPPLVTGITLGSTVAGNSGMTVQVGNTQMGTVSDTAVDPVTEPGAPAVVEDESPPTPPKIVKARLIKKSRVKPEYTPTARRQGIEGLVVVRIRIDKTGRVTQVTVKSGLGYGLDEATVKAVKQWRYRPKTIDGRSVSSKRVERIEFILND